MTNLSPQAEEWERRYQTRSQLWSGRPQPTLVEVAESLPPGRSVDLGTGEGADVLWLAEHGWEALGLDLSPTAIARARDEAERRGQERAQFRVGDFLTDPELVPGSYDLVTAFFIHPRTAAGRQQFLARATSLVAPGGHLLVVSHAREVKGTNPGIGHGPSPVDPAEDERLLRSQSSFRPIRVGVEAGLFLRAAGTRETRADAVVFGRID